MAENKDIKNEEEQPSNAQSTQPNDKESTPPKDKDGSSLIKRLTKVAKEYPRIATSVGAVILGGLAFWEGYGQWWFGFDLPLWIYFVLPASLLVIWLFAFCGYYREVYPERMPALKKEEQEEKVKLRCLSLNMFVMIAIPVLLLGIVGGYLAMEWHLTEKIVILVEPFEDIGEVQDGRASGKDPEGIAEAVQSCLEKAIPRNKRRKVSVVLGKRHENGSGKEMPLDERALKYRADMVISGWYINRENESLVCPKFQVFRTPKPLSTAFRQSGGAYPKTFVFSNKEVENFNVNFILAKRLTYEATLVLGAGAYASSDWKTAQQFFRTALQEIEKLESPEKESETKKSGASSIEHENLKGDEALLQLYMGHCLMNQSEFGSAIQRYDDAIEAGKKIPRGDMRYGEILASAYLARGVAYRQVNAFELARQDFETAGGHLPTSLGLRPLHAEEARFLSGDREKLVNGAKNYYSRGEKYLIQREYKHAQAYLEMSAEFYRTLMRGMPTPIQEEYSLELARSLVRLGETHGQLALPEVTDDENTKRAITHLTEADRLTRRFSEQKNRNMLEIRADSLRHLGEAYRAQDQNDEVEKAIDYHEKAESIWLELEERKNTIEEQTRIVRKVAGEQTRIGNVHRRLDDLDPDPNSRVNHLENAICAYKKAIEKLGGAKYLKITYSGSTDNQDGGKEKQELLNKTKKQITTHHLANSVCTLAETHIKRFLAESDETDPNKQSVTDDIRIACELLEYASECYCESEKKLQKDEDWRKQIQEEERNQSLKDDIAWCLTLRGYALVKQGRLTDVNDPNCYYKQITTFLDKARNNFEELRDIDQGHLVLNLFALTVSQYKLGMKPEARKTFLDACMLLRRLTREKKKVWYVDYVCDIMNELMVEGFRIADTKEDKCNFVKLQVWLNQKRVRDGRRALDEIIRSMQKRLKAAGETDS